MTFSIRLSPLCKRRWLVAGALGLLMIVPVSADQIRLTNGRVLEVDATWEDASGVWYRRGNITQLLDRSQVKGIIRASKASVIKNAGPVKVVEKVPPRPIPISIYLVGGALFEVDEASESQNGVWYRRGSISSFLGRERIEKIVRGESLSGGSAESALGRSVRSWSTGKSNLDVLIKESGARHRVDPFLIFCVMEQESHFNARAVSPKGARGLMQLMPGTARRFGVRSVFDAAENITGGTRYIKELLEMYGGRVDLVLASYNAGEGAVNKYGRNVPPYRETRDYVKRISARYGSMTHQNNAQDAKDEPSVTTPR